MIFLKQGAVIDNENFSITYYNNNGPSRVVLSVPHDGLAAENFTGLFTPRSLGWKGADKYTGPLVNDVMFYALQNGLSVDAVRFLMARMFVDANREVPTIENIDSETRGQVAYDDMKLARVFAYYHEQIDYLLQRSICKFGQKNVLFLDVHGFGKQPEFAPKAGYDLILGTANRSTINYGTIDVTFAEFMEGCGYTVFLPTETPIRPSGDPYSAGHITRLYAKKYSINVVQIEIASKFRQKESQEKGKKLAKDIAEFLAANYK